jgi:thiamine biosynthesis lipoprotein
MRETRDIMGMPVIVEIVDGDENTIEKVFDYFRGVDERFSTYKDTSEISRINQGELKPSEYSSEMKEVRKLCDVTQRETSGYFDITRPDGSLDPSGLVKGWAINNAADILRKAGIKNFWVEAGGDIQTSGVNSSGQEWSVGIRNPFKKDEIVKVVYPRAKGIATSGTYIRGNHIYDPHSGKNAASDIVSLTIIGPNVYEADRFATAAFAMGKGGIHFIETLTGFEGYAIDTHGTATMTSGFPEYTERPH